MQISPYTLVIALHCETRLMTEEEITTQAVTILSDVDSESTTTESSTTITEPTTTAIPTITTCSAKGQLYMSSNMTILFEANADTLTIKAQGEDFQVFCDFFNRSWSETVWYIAVYGLDEDKNNFDDHFYLSTNLNLCNLQTDDELTVKFV